METDINPATIKLALKRVPLMLKTIILKLLSLSPVKGKQGWRMELIVTFIRSFYIFGTEASKLQKNSLKDPGVKGDMWISKVQLPKPQESDVLNSLLKAIDYHKTGNETYDIPDLDDVGVEWTGYRKGTRSSDPQPDISEEEKYAKMMDEVEEDFTILYIHGGAYHLMDPCSHRGATMKLSKLTRARCLSVRYRLAPQNPFPAALLDVLVAYFSLLSPAEGSTHPPVPANKIVVAGESAGGGLSLALTQTLLTLRRILPSKTLRFNGRDVPIELPAGVAVASPWCDLTRSLPSSFTNAKFDYIPAPHLSPPQLYTPMPFPADSTWPTTPPRVEFYANADILSHPFVSPVAGSMDIWKDSPPIFISIGEECLSDDGIYLARKIQQVGGNKVVVEQFEGMPHCFGYIAPTTVQGRRFFKSMAGFCLDAVHDRVQCDGEFLSINHAGTESESLKIGSVGSLSDEEVRRRVVAGKDWRVEGERELLKQWTETQPRARL